MDLPEIVPDILSRCRPGCEIPSQRLSAAFSGTFWENVSQLSSNLLEGHREALRTSGGISPRGSLQKRRRRHFCR